MPPALRGRQSGTAERLDRGALVRGEHRAEPALALAGVDEVGRCGELGVAGAERGGDVAMEAQRALDRALLADAAPDPRGDGAAGEDAQERAQHGVAAGVSDDLVERLVGLDERL